MKKEYIRKRVERRFRRIAEKEKITYSELYKVFKSQFLFTKNKIEELEKEWLSTATEEELEELVFNYIFLGKVHSSRRLQELGNNKNRSKNGRSNKKTEGHQED